MTWLLTGVKAVVSVFTSALDALFKWVGVIGAYFLGKRAAQADMNEEALEIKNEQMDIASKPGLHRDTLLERMRRRKRD